MAEEDKRTATDILLSIESKLIKLEGRVQNSEYLLKTLLGKINKQSVSTAQSSSKPTIYESDIINKDNFENRIKTNKFVEIAASQGVSLEDNSGVVNFSNDLEEASLRGEARGQRGVKLKGPKSSVSQVLNRGNDILFLANIEVLDENNELVSQTRTNTKGRWMMSLAPGDYQVHVTKRFSPDSGKRPIDTMYQIMVPKSDKPIELEPYVVEE